MRITVDKETGVLTVAVDAIAAFARQKNADGAPLGFVPVPDDEVPTDARTDVLYTTERDVGLFACKITGVAPLIYLRGETLALEFEKAVRRRDARPMDDPAFFSRALLTAYLAAAAQGRDSVAVRLRLTRERAGECSLWESRFSADVLGRMFDALLTRAAPFIEIEGARQTEGRADLSALSFPYRAVREGQRDFMEELFRCVRTRRRLLVSAPTGIGKTMSAIYPSLKAVGAGRADRVFYFTAKTVTGNAALDAIRTLGAQASHLRCIRVTAKERVCPVRAKDSAAVTDCRRCSFCTVFEGVSYEERRDAALLHLLRGVRVYDTAEIGKVAAEHHLCPYELALDLSEYCEVIVCDYGYLFDPQIAFRRYFADDTARDERYVFLVDEAHNLPDRAREMYSATLTRASFNRFFDQTAEAFPDDRALKDACDVVRAMFDGTDALCGENAEVRDETGAVSGCILEKSVPAFVPDAVARLRAVCEAYLRRDFAGAMPLFGEMRAALRAFADALTLMDDRFAFYAEASGGETALHLLCLDPSAILDRALAKGVTAVLFSATLSPMEYYADVCGMADAIRLELPSPYEKENLCLITVDSVSTRFSQRRSSAADVAELIAAVTESREGNYIIYFPSYAYMTSVCKQYLKLSPGGKTIMQRQGMSLGERERFLQAFARAEERGESLVAFCVLGGIFSEGIDLRGKRLIGTVIVGIGLPGLSSELNILTEYYDRTRESGRDYAYTYPAMNKILQAAGRVIRSEEDRGVVVLIDDRYRDPGIRRLFPAHWSRMQYTGDAYSLSTVLERFWQASP